MHELLISQFGVLILLTDERWDHIVEHHSELVGLRGAVLETVESPDRIIIGRGSELLAVKEHMPGQWLMVAYRELGSDGFIITAFLTSNAISLEHENSYGPKKL